MASGLVVLRGAPVMGSAVVELTVDDVELLSPPLRLATSDRIQMGVSRTFSRLDAQIRVGPELRGRDQARAEAARSAPA
jgi:hypothetical protein